MALKTVVALRMLGFDGLTTEVLADLWVQPVRRVPGWRDNGSVMMNDIHAVRGSRRTQGDAPGSTVRPVSRSRDSVM